MDIYKIKEKEIENEINKQKPYVEQVDTNFFNSCASLFIYNSNKLSENNQEFSEITLEDTNKIIYEYTAFENNQLEFQQINSSTSEKRKINYIIQHYNVLKDMYDKRKQPLTLDQILIWHNDLKLGSLKSVGYRDYWKVMGDRVFVDPSLIESKLKLLVHSFNTQKSKQNYSCFSLSAWLLHSFSCIHPFENGNGKMARLLSNFALFSFDFPCPVPFFNSAQQVQYATSQCDQLVYKSSNYQIGTCDLTLMIIKNSIKIYKLFSINYIGKNWGYVYFFLVNRRVNNDDDDVYDQYQYQH